VLIPAEDRVTLCVSSQAGCSLACTFCHTGKQGFMKNLTSGQILAQFMARSNSHATHPKTITNIVFMGQGEPLLNWKYNLS
jgi:23S rRNA (adenine2503-C2)-methyltransferase